MIPSPASLREQIEQRLQTCETLRSQTNNVEACSVLDTQIDELKWMLAIVLSSLSAERPTPTENEQENARPSGAEEPKVEAARAASPQQE